MLRLAVNAMRLKNGSRLAQGQSLKAEAAFASFKQSINILDATEGEMRGSI